jgi:hypothetical protein
MTPALTLTNPCLLRAAEVWYIGGSSLPYCRHTLQHLFRVPTRRGDLYTCGGSRAARSGGPISLTFTLGAGTRTAALNFIHSPSSMAMCEAPWSAVAAATAFFCAYVMVPEIERR